MDAWMQEEIDALVAAHGTVPPPWVVYYEHPHSLCWRMGGGESLMMVWSEWWPQQNLTEAQRIEYFRKWKPPHCWLAWLIDAIWGVDYYDEDDETLAPYFERTQALGFGSRQDWEADYSDDKWLETEHTALVADVSLTALHDAIVPLNQRLKPLAERRIDTSDPHWEIARRNAPPALDEAGVRTEAEAALNGLVNAYVIASAEARADLRKLVAENRAFSWATGVPEPPTTEAGFRKHLLWMSLIDDSRDMRDTLLNLRALCDDARAAGVNISPVLNEVAVLSNDTGGSYIGSMRSLLKAAADRR